jgi:hypothetical protein
MKHVHAVVVVIACVDGRRGSDALARLVAGVRLMVVASAGHGMMYPYPNALSALIDGFIRQTGRDRIPDAPAPHR